MQKKFVGDKCGRGREGQHGYKQQQTRSSVGGKAKNTTRTHSFYQHNTGACMRGSGKKKDKQIYTSPNQSISNRACGGRAKKNPKENTKPTPSSAKEHEGRKTNTTHRPTPTTVEQSGNRETTTTTMDTTTEKEGRVKSHLEKPEKRPKQKRTKQKGNKHLIRPNG
jgi:hypothetical protein